MTHFSDFSIDITPLWRGAQSGVIASVFSMRQRNDKIGAECVDREEREYLALRKVGTNVDESTHLIKCIQETTTNTKHHSLAQTVFSTCNMTFKTATPIFNSYNLPTLLPHRVYTQFFVDIVRDQITKLIRVVRRRKRTTRRQAFAVADLQGSTFYKTMLSVLY